MSIYTGNEILRTAFYRGKFISKGYQNVNNTVKEIFTDNIYTLTIDPVDNQGNPLTDYILTFFNYGTGVIKDNSITVKSGTSVSYTINKDNYFMLTNTKVVNSNQTVTETLEEKYTLTFIPTPSDATVTLEANGYETVSGVGPQSISTSYGTLIHSYISKNGYVQDNRNIANTGGDPITINLSQITSSYINGYIGNNNTTFIYKANNGYFYSKQAENSYTLLNDVTEGEFSRYLTWWGYKSSGSWIKDYDHYLYLSYLDSVNDTTVSGYPYKYIIVTSGSPSYTKTLYPTDNNYRPIYYISDPDHESEPNCILRSSSWYNAMYNNMSLQTINNSINDCIYNNKLYRYFDQGINSNYTYKAYSTNATDHSSGTLYFMTQNISELKYTANEHNSYILYKNQVDSDSHYLCAISPDNDRLVFENGTYCGTKTNTLSVLNLYRASEFDCNELPLQLILDIPYSSSTSYNFTHKQNKLSVFRNSTLQEVLNKLDSTSEYTIGYTPRANSDSLSTTEYFQQLIGYSTNGNSNAMVTPSTYRITNNTTLYAVYEFIIPKTYTMNITFGTLNATSYDNGYSTFYGYSYSGTGTINSGYYIKSGKDFVFGLREPTYSGSVRSSTVYTYFSYYVYGYNTLTISINGKSATRDLYGDEFFWGPTVAKTLTKSDGSTTTSYSSCLEDYFTSSDFSGTKTVVFTLSKK